MVSLVVGELARWYSQHSLIGVDSGFLGTSISEFQPLGLISALRLVMICGVSDGTKVSRTDDKSS